MLIFIVASMVEYDIDGNDALEQRYQSKDFSHTRWWKKRTEDV